MTDGSLEELVGRTHDTLHLLFEGDGIAQYISDEAGQSARVSAP